MIEQANARRADSKKTVFTSDEEPIRLASIPVNLGTRSSEIPVITNKADLLTQSSLSAMDLSKQEDFSATASRLQDPQITTSLREVEVVAKYEERLNAHLNFSMLMNSFDSESTDGSP